MWLLDCADGYFSKPEDELNAKIDVLADEVSLLKQELEKLKQKPEEKKSIRMVNGKIIEK